MRKNYQATQNLLFYQCFIFDCFLCGNQTRHLRSLRRFFLFVFTNVEVVKAFVTIPMETAQTILS
jgi:hypothetical protein